MTQLLMRRILKVLEEKIVQLDTKLSQTEILFTSNLNQERVRVIVPGCLPCCDTGT